MSFNYFTDTGFINLLREYVNKATPAFQTGILQVLDVDKKRVMFTTDYLVRDGKDNLTRQYSTYLILRVDGGFEHSVIVLRSDDENKKADRTIPNTVELAGLAERIFTLGTTGKVVSTAKQADKNSQDLDRLAETLLGIMPSDYTVQVAGYSIDGNVITITAKSYEETPSYSVYMYLVYESYSALMWVRGLGYNLPNPTSFYELESSQDHVARRIIAINNELKAKNGNN